MYKRQVVPRDEKYVINNKGAVRQYGMEVEDEEKLARPGFNKWATNWLQDVYKRQSFVLTQKPSYLLASTTSCDYYSTEFDQYEDLINTIYTTVNDVLSKVKGCEWIGRKVLDDGVIANEYLSLIHIFRF